MRIAHVALRFDSPGGVETTVRELTTRLRQTGDSVEVYAGDLVDESGWVRGANFRSEVDGVPVHRFRALKRSVLPRTSFPALLGLSDALAAADIDVLHAHSHRYGHVLQAAAVARRRGIPLVVSPHYHPADPGEPSFKRGLLRVQDFLYGAAAYRDAAALVVESLLEARLVAEFAPRDRIHVIPPGIDGAQWRTPEPLALPTGTPKRYVLFVGRLAPNKGLTILFEALAAMPLADRPTLLLMGPDWGMRTTLEGLAHSRGIDANIVWLDRVDDLRTYRSVVRSAESLVLPSAWEAYGLVLLDALAAGTPVVATAVGGVPEVLEGGRCGRLVNYGDTAGLAAALRSVTADPETTLRLARAGLERAQALDWSVSVERHRALYRRVAAG